jgi:hypothetical protein
MNMRYSKRTTNAALGIQQYTYLSSIVKNSLSATLRPESWIG